MFEFASKLLKNLEKSYNKRYHANLMENNILVKEHGLKVFMKEKKEKYTCPQMPREYFYA